MAKKTFVVNAAERSVTPSFHRICVGDEIEWKLDKGKAVVVFEPDGQGPVLSSHGPDFDPQAPALATAQTSNEYPHSVCYWFMQGGKKEQHSLQMVLIIDP